MKVLGAKWSRLAFFIMSNKKRQKISVLLLVFPLVLTASLIEIVLVNNSRLFPIMALKYDLEGDSQISFEIHGVIGSSLNVSWQKLSSLFFDETLSESMAYVPESLLTIFGDPKFKWQTELINHSSLDYDSITFIGLPNRILQKIILSFNLDHNVTQLGQGILIGKNVNQTTFNVTGISEIPSAPFADQHPFTIVDGLELTASSRERLESILGTDLYDIGVIGGGILLPYNLLLEFINSFERILTVVSCYAQWEWQIIEEGNYNVASLNKTLNELVRKSGYLYTNPNFNVQYHHELIPFFQTYNKSIRSYWIGSLSLIIPTLLVILFLMFLCLRIVKDAFKKDINIIRHHGVNLSLILILIIIERLFHIIGALLLVSFFTFCLKLITPVKNQFFFNFFSLTYIPLLISLFLIGFFYISYSIVTGVIEYYRENDTTDTKQIQTVPFNMRIIAGIIAVFSILFLINVGLSWFLHDIISSETSHILESFSILFLENITIFTGIFCLMILIELIFLILNRSNKLIGISKNIHKIDFNLISIIFISFILFVTALILPFALNYHTRTQLNLNIPTDMVISNLPIDDEEKIISTIENYSIQQNWATAIILKVKTKYFPHTYFFGISNNFQNLSSMKSYIYNNKWNMIPNFNESMEKPRVLISSNVKQLDNLVLINTTKDIAGGQYNKSYEVVLELDLINYFDAFPFVGETSHNKSNYGNLIPQIICSISLVRFIIANIKNSVLFSDLAVFINGNLDNLVSIQNQLLDYSEISTIILKEEHKSIYENIYQVLIIRLNDFNLIIATVFIPVLIFIISIGSEKRNLTILKYYKLIHYKKRSLIKGQIGSTSLYLVITTILGLIAVTIILQLIINIFQLIFITRELLYSQITSLLLLSLIFNGIWLTLLLLGYLFNLKNTKLMYFSEE